MRDACNNNTLCCVCDLERKPRITYPKFVSNPWQNGKCRERMEKTTTTTQIIFIINNNLGNSTNQTTIYTLYRTIVINALSIFSFGLSQFRNISYSQRIILYIHTHTCCQLEIRIYSSFLELLSTFTNTHKLWYFMNKNHHTKSARSIRIHNRLLLWQVCSCL